VAIAPILDPDLRISDYPGVANVSVLPQPNDADIAWARSNPGDTRHFVDPTADKSSLTEANVIGSWHAEADGRIQQWLNPNFVPTPIYAMRDIATEFELVLWRVEYGFNSIGHLIDGFARAEFIIILSADDPAGERGWPLLHGRGDAVGIALYTSEGWLPGDVNPWLRRKVSGRVVLTELCGDEHMTVVFNRNMDGCFELRGTRMLGWWRDWQQTPTAGPTSR
jgi:hypothetical protein